LLALLPGLFQLKAQSDLQLAQNILAEHAAELGLAAGDYDCLQLNNHYESRLSKVQHYYFTQCYQGVEVYRAVFNMHIQQNGELLTWGSRLVPNLVSRIQATAPSLTAADAVEEAAAAMGYPVPDSLVVKSQAGGAAQAVVFEKGELSVEDIPVRLVYQPMPDGSLRLAWDLNIQQMDGAHWWSLRVDALNGQLLERNDWVISCDFGHPHPGGESHGHGMEDEPTETLDVIEKPVMAGVYNVYPQPVESPSHGIRQLVADPEDLNASPFGWHDTNGAAGAEFTITRGNNVYAQLDDDNNNGTFGFAPDGGSSLVFDFPINLNQQPSTYASAAITNLFYWNNYLHDFSYRYGFDEASGNFQVNNYGNGGAGGDEVIADAQDAGGSNNANFATPTDGSRPRMQMYLWNLTSPQRDGDLDNGIIAHEYAHGISIRQTGGPSNSGCLNNQEQMGEGWSDYFSLMTTMEPGDMGADSRGIGTYALGQPPSGGGIRPTPYSTLMSINPTTYGDIGGLAVPHGVGYAWCTMLWEVTWGLIADHGMANGFDIAMNIVNEGLKLQPCSPGFVDGRNAILAADQAIYGGANACTIWAAFAKRGLGFSAVQGSTSNTNDGTEAFDLPTSCTMDVQPTFVSVCQPSHAVYTVTVGANNGNVVLSATGVPAGGFLDFSLNPVPSPGSSTMTIGSTGAIAPGTYVINVEGAGSSTTINKDVTLKVTAGLPALPSLLSPDNNATGVALSPTLSWAANANTDTFTVELASDAAFANIVASAAQTGNSFQVPASLTALTQYWWRVKAKNACGQTAFSPVFTFTTANVLCMTRFSPNVPVTIPTSASTVTSLLNMPIQGSIQDVNVKTLNINHSWIDDLIISVKSPANTSVTLMSRPCNSENNILTNLDDEASSSNYPCPPTNNGTYIPFSPLSAVDGQNPLGPWTLEVQDVFAQDGGSIQNWGLEVCYIPAPTCGGTFTDSGGAGANYQNSEDITTTLCPDGPGQTVTVSFNSFSVQNNSDFLYVHDGPDVNAPLIATLTGTTVPGSFTSSSPDGCLTFRFTSNGSTVSSGWNADVTCCVPTTETCNGIDDDCDGDIDEGVQLTFYQNLDGDEFGNPDVSVMACSAPPGYVSENTDCDDTNPNVNPNAAEICNGIDDDCDTNVDENLLSTFYQDADGDSFGNLLQTAQACTAPQGYVSDNTDCDDGNNAIYPNAPEACNLLDDDCDLDIDEGVLNTFYEDSDGDSYGNLLQTALACTAPPGYVSDNTDCDDGNNAIYPNAPEACNLLDDDCDLDIDEGVLNTFYADADADSYGNPLQTALACTVPPGYVSDNMDCDDGNNQINPAATELCNLLDDDCSGAPEAATNTWTGAGNGTDWSDANNWSDGIVPLECQDVVVPAGFEVVVPTGFDAVGRTLDVPLSGQIQVLGTMLIQD
jgi:subtilisin-like proprotein convertase family protein